MDKNRICKICNRRFANGKAMGGHMRSHLAKLPLPPKYNPSEQTEPPSSGSPNPSSSASSLNYPFIENPMQSYPSVNHSSFMSKSNLGTLRDGERYSKKPTQIRLKQRRKSLKKKAESVVKADSTEQVSSISYIFSEEEAAMCLLMLSTDKEVMNECIEEEGEDDLEDEDESFGVIQVGSKTQGMYRCETCKKGFLSYHALGGHKASHKERGIESRIFKCPFCKKVFEQALSSHKKVHFSYVGDAKIPIKKSADNLLDLNLPAPEYDGEA